MKDMNDKTIKALEKTVESQQRLIKFLQLEIYELESEGVSCCGDELDEDIMICPTCKEHC